MQDAKGIRPASSNLMTDVSSPLRRGISAVMSVPVQAASKPEGPARAMRSASRISIAAQDKSLRPERYPVHPEPVCIDSPSDQQRQQGSRSRQGVDMPVSQERAPGAAQKPARSKPGQPRDASLTALARAPGTLQEPSKIGVRMPGDPPRCAPRTCLSAHVRPGPEQLIKYAEHTMKC